MGRLKRWFVFFCRAEGTQGSGVAGPGCGIRAPFCTWEPPLPSPPPPHGNPYGKTTCPQDKHAGECRLLTRQAWASSRATLRASRGFSMMRPVWPEKSIATSVLSETLLCTPGGTRRGAVRTGPPCPRNGVWVPTPTHAPVYTHQGWGPHTGRAQVARLCLLVILIQLHPILGRGERKRARGQAGAGVPALTPPPHRPPQEQGCVSLCPGMRSVWKPEL